MRMGLFLQKGWPSQTTWFLTLYLQLRLCRIRPLLPFQLHLVHVLVHNSPTSGAIFASSNLLQQSPCLCRCSSFCWEAPPPRSLQCGFSYYPDLSSDVSGHLLWSSPFLHSSFLSAQAILSILIIIFNFPYCSFAIVSYFTIIVNSKVIIFSCRLL